MRPTSTRKSISMADDYTAMSYEELLRYFDVSLPITETLPYGGFAATRGCTPCAALRLSLHTHKNSTHAVGVCTIFAGFIILSGR